MPVHGNNIIQKETSDRKYSSEESQAYLREIRTRYLLWQKENEALRGPFVNPSPNDASIIKKRVKSFTAYKDFLDQQHYAEHFDSRSNLHSSALEEFLEYLFRDLVSEFSASALFGKSHTFKDMFFAPPDFQRMLERPNMKIETKDHDFVIGVTLHAMVNCVGSSEVVETKFDIPALAIECKTYLDKTMLEGSSTAAEQLKVRNPNAKYLVVSEWLKLTESVNLKKYKVDQIYILRKQKNTDREYRYAASYQKNPIYADAVLHLFEYVRMHLTSNWETGVSAGLERGYLL